MNDLAKHYIKTPMKQVYVVENEHGAVKIGISQNVNSRINVLSKQGGFKPMNIYCTEMCSKGYEVERQIHKAIEPSRIDSEWFRLSFNEAVKIVSTIFKSKARFDIKKQRCVLLEDIERLFNMA